ncbi:hypothetical protein CDD83_6847 [Cordyceps sp. RAO-2017]|nr:hypothetical protein CDD83_6847 [Cordyceps sp. RAO-2017]
MAVTADVERRPTASSPPDASAGAGAALDSRARSSPLCICICSYPTETYPTETYATETSPTETYPTERAAASLPKLGQRYLRIRRPPPAHVERGDPWRITSPHRGGGAISACSDPRRSGRIAREFTNNLIKAGHCTRPLQTQAKPRRSGPGAYSAGRAGQDKHPSIHINSSRASPGLDSSALPSSPPYSRIPPPSPSSRD